jgi:hypothetical protein
MRKMVQIPILPHLAKFVKASSRFDFIRSNMEYLNAMYGAQTVKCLKVKHYIPVNRVSKRDAEKWFANVTPDYQWIYVEVQDPTITRLFYLNIALQNCFLDQLIEHMTIEKAISKNAKLGLDKFLDKCDISENDYKVATGYKHWQRYQKKLIQKNAA